MKSTFFAAVLALTPAVFAQNAGTFGGPAILTSGLPSVGQRSGEDVDLRVFANAVGIYDTGLAPFAVDSTGKLLQPEGQYGAEVGLGAYGRHTFRRSVIGLDYQGNIRRYPDLSNFNSTNQQLNLQYTVQKSRKLLFDFGAQAALQNFGTAFGPNFGSTGGFDTNSLLFDNRTAFLQGNAQAVYALTNRTAFSMGGTIYTSRRKAQALADVNGYQFQGTISHQMGRDTVLGVAYQHIHHGFSGIYGQSDMELFNGQITRKFKRRWTLYLSGGVFVTAVKGVQNTTLDPAIAALLGTGSIATAFYKETLLPMAEARLAYQLRRSALSFGYSRTVTPGNGVYLSSRQESFDGSYSYTGFRRMSLSLGAGMSNMNSIGQSFQQFKQYNGTANVTYRVGGGFDILASYGRRFQEIDSNIYKQNSSRVSVGLAFSPGTLPISFH